MPGGVFYISSIKYQISAPLIFDESFFIFFDLIGVCLLKFNGNQFHLKDNSLSKKDDGEQKDPRFRDKIHNFPFKSLLFVCLQRHHRSEIEISDCVRKRTRWNIFPQENHNSWHFENPTRTIFLLPSVSLNISSSFNFINFIQQYI